MRKLLQPRRDSYHETYIHMAFDFSPLHFNPFSSKTLDKYRIPDQQKTPENDMAIADYEPKKNKGRKRLLRKCEPLTRGTMILESLVTGVYHNTLFEDRHTTYRVLFY